MIREYPQNVFALKGNHEDYTESGEPTFWPCSLAEEARKKRGDWQKYFKSEFKPFVDRLQLAILVPGETLFVHGGISSKIRSLKDLEHPTREIERDVLWADPFEEQGEHPNPERRTSVEFGADVTESICKLLRVERIIRNHQPANAPAGPFYSYNRRVITTSSTNVYSGKPFILNIDPADSSRPRLVSWDFLGS